ncbi:fumarylacetoacetate hydrolase family protein [uncultured Pseudoteredinibacter sp.]|uniref:fumarylacetoacetate hydrolase family protein n=1 Tax=uncultured Pseudoteredinibacter sp. TaxID=1641701 RepID=UPI00262EE5D5|nr:fumarylacetoacetate hydrolase family protein [uncultured Pseudoteredinibacter sp.]
MRTIPFPSSIGEVFALGLTYKAHIEEVGAKETEPMIFAKHCSATVGDCDLSLPNEDSLWQALESLNPDIAQKVKATVPTMPLMLDYEVELGMYLDEDVTSEQLNQPGWMPRLGLFLANDISARSLQLCGELAASEKERMEYWTLSKSLPGFLPVAETIFFPETLSPDTFPDIELSLSVNGEQRQKDNCRNMIYPPKLMLEYALKAAGDRGLKAGDCILTGTPAGVALRLTAFKKFMAKILPAKLRVKLALKGAAKEPNYLKVGDVVQISANDLGAHCLRICE